MEQKFKPFEKVLEREDKESEWSCALYSHYDNVLKSHCAMGAYFKECIPYEGNEALLGTTDEPKPKRWRAKKYERYWFVTLTAEVEEDVDSYVCWDKSRYDAGNYFRTKKEAQAVANGFKQLLTGE